MITDRWLWFQAYYHLIRANIYCWNYLLTGIFDDFIIAMSSLDRLCVECWLCGWIQMNNTATSLNPVVRIEFLQVVMTDAIGFSPPVDTISSSLTCHCNNCFAVRHWFVWFAGSIDIYGNSVIFSALMGIFWCWTWAKWFPCVGYQSICAFLRVYSPVRARVKLVLRFSLHRMCLLCISTIIAYFLRLRSENLGS